MARLPRIVVAGVPHHITQRGNRRQKVFFSDADYALYLELLAEWSEKEGLGVAAYCLMPNHIHLIAIPAAEKSLHRAIKEVHRRYSCHVNLRENWRGYLWQGRFSSFPMDGLHCFHAIQYAEQNPVRAGLVASAEEWEWSSARHRRDPALATHISLAAIDSGELPDGSQGNVPASMLDAIRRHENTGRPLASNEFIKELEERSGRDLLPKKRGPKPKVKS